MNSVLKITSISEISAIYFALLQCGYDFYSIERSPEHTAAIRSFTGCAVPEFFSGVRQNTCEVYPYWPRAAMLETATFYLSADRSRFMNFDAFRERIMSAPNIADQERNGQFWDWIEAFPPALSEVIAGTAFARYLQWENDWIAGQNLRFAEALRPIQACLDTCIGRYGSPVRSMQIIINPIKCVYSTDYYLNGDCFVFSSGSFRADSVIHEFLHHVLHPVVSRVADQVTRDNIVYPGLDTSYYLSGDKIGRLNAFEEYAVRKLTAAVMTGVFPQDLDTYLIRLIEATDQK